MWSTAAKNLMLTAITDTYVGLHDDYPGDTGAHELSGGSPAYARQQVTLSVASAGQRLSAETPAIDVPAGTVAWSSLWSAASAGTYLGCHPQGGIRQRFQSDPGTDTITAYGHGFVDTDKIVFFGAGLAPTGLTKGVTYFVRDATATTFKVAATSGGSAIDLTAAGGAEVWVSKIVPLTYGSQGTYTLAGVWADLNS